LAWCAWAVNLPQRLVHVRKSLKEPILKSLIAAFGFCLATLSSQAQVQITTSLSGVTLELIDLTPGDATSPWVSSSGGRASGHASYVASDGNMESLTYNLANVGDVTRNLTASPLTSTFSIHGDGQGTFSSTSSGRFSSNIAPSSERSQTETSTITYSYLTLSPGTQVKLSAIATIHAESDVSLAPGLINDAYGRVELGLYDNTYNYSIDDLTYKAPGNSGTFLSHQEKQMTLTLANTFDTPMSFSIIATTFSRQSVSPIPEPATLGMFAFGLIVFIRSVKRNMSSAL
jgi:hypothetical protein